MSEITLLLTANHQGNLRWMARLYTALNRLKKQLEGHVFLIDSGGACSDDVWICQATENRAPYVVMDAMGYDVSFADGLLEETLQQLQSTVQMQLVPPDSMGMLTLANQVLKLCVDAETSLKDGVLILPQPPQGMIRQIKIEVDTMSLLGVEAIPVPPNEPLEPTIMAVVEFVESEARYYQQKKKGNTE